METGKNIDTVILVKEVLFGSKSNLSLFLCVCVCVCDLFVKIRVIQKFKLQKKKVHTHKN